MAKLFDPRGSMQLYSRYMGLKVVTIYNDFGAYVYTIKLLGAFGDILESILGTHGTFRLWLCLYRGLQRVRWKKRGVASAHKAFFVFVAHASHR